MSIKSDIVALSIEQDSLFDDAVKITIESGRGSVSLLQRRLHIGYNRACRTVERMTQAGILGERKGCQVQEVIATLDEYKAVKVKP